MKWTVEECNDNDNNVVCYVPSLEIYNLLKTKFPNMCYYKVGMLWYLLPRQGFSKDKEVYLMGNYNIITHHDISNLGDIVYSNKLLKFKFV